MFPFSNSCQFSFVPAETGAGSSISGAGMASAPEGLRATQQVEAVILSSRWANASAERMTRSNPVSWTGQEEMVEDTSQRAARRSRASGSRAWESPPPPHAPLAAPFHLPEIGIRPRCSTH